MGIPKLVLVCAAVAMLGAIAVAKLPHTLRGEGVAGEVVDADTGRPIPGVHVALVWEAPINPSGFTGHNSRTICYHAAAAVSDERGGFSIPAWRKWSTYDVDSYGPVALVYARNYVPQQISLQHDAGVPEVARASERFALKAFAGSTTQRIQVLFFGLANRSCDYGGESKRSFYPMLKDIYVEVRQIARTSEEQSMTRIVAEFAADAALASNPNGPANDERSNAFIEEHLQ